MTSLTTKIRLLNKAYTNIKNGLIIIKSNITITKNIELYLWRLDKTVQELNQEILKEIQKENMKNEVNKIIKNNKHDI